MTLDGRITDAMTVVAVERLRPAPGAQLETRRGSSRDRDRAATGTPSSSASARSGRLRPTG